MTERPVSAAASRALISHLAICAVVVPALAVFAGTAAGARAAFGSASLGLPDGDDVEAPTLERALEAFDSGNPEDALVLAESALETQAEEPSLLALAARAAAATDDHDLALWYADFALDALGEPPADKGLEQELRGLVTEWDTIAQEHADLEREFKDFTQELYGLGRGCAGRKLFVNAVDLLLRCQGTSFERRASKELERLYSDRNSATAILEFGWDLPEAPMTEREASRLAKSDARHSEWENAYDKKTKNYRIITNMGDKMVDQLAVAMEQMNRAYRKIFSHKGNTTRCTIKVYKTRAEFDAFHGMSPGVRGFYSPGENMVVTYDPRTESSPGSLDSLWNTLFHEASHQFTHEISRTLTPGWLNEGTASYFEGARLMPNGTVIENGIPEGRLRSLRMVLDRGEPRVRQVLAYYQPGSYPGSFYPVGWGLVYFLHNWEDEECERPYIKQYERYLRAYRKGDRHEVMGRFVEHFIEDAKIPGVETLADFENRFKEWIYRLHDDYFGPKEKAQNWVDLARKRLKFDKEEAALEAYRYALHKDPAYIPALFEIADLQYAMKQKDPAILNLRKALDIARRLPEDEVVAGVQLRGSELVEECLKRLERYDRTLAVGLRRAATDFRATADTIATAYYEGGFPRRALAVLDDAVALVGGDLVLEAKRDDFAARSGVDVRRTRVLTFDPEGSESWVVDGDSVSPKGDYLNTLLHGITPSKSYQLTVTASVEGSAPFGLVYAGDQNYGRLFGPVLFRFSFHGDELSPEDLGRLPPTKEVELMVDVSPRRIEYYVNGNKLDTLEQPTFSTSGRVGLWGSEGVTFSNFRIRE